MRCFLLKKSVNAMNLFMIFMLAISCKSVRDSSDTKGVAFDGGDESTVIWYLIESIPLKTSTKVAYCFYGFYADYNVVDASQWGAPGHMNALIDKFQDGPFRTITNRFRNDHNVAIEKWQSIVKRDLSFDKFTNYPIPKEVFRDIPEDLIARTDKINLISPLQNTSSYQGVFGRGEYPRLIEFGKIWRAIFENENFIGQATDQTICPDDAGSVLTYLNSVNEKEYSRLVSTDDF